MRFDILTLFPEMVETVLNTSITGRAAEAGYIDVRARNIRDGDAGGADLSRRAVGQPA